MGFQLSGEYDACKVSFGCIRGVFRNIGVKEEGAGME